MGALSFVLARDGKRTIVASLVEDAQADSSCVLLPCLAAELGEKSLADFQ